MLPQEEWKQHLVSLSLDAAAEFPEATIYFGISNFIHITAQFTHFLIFFSPSFSF